MMTKPGPGIPAYLRYLLYLVLGLAGFATGVLVEVDGVSLITYLVQATWSWLINEVPSITQPEISR
jgi:hypothetical protein